MIETVRRSIPQGTRIRLLFEDEGRFGRISDRRRCWAPLPIRPEVGHQIVREYTYAFMAVSPLDGRSASLILPWSNAQTMSIFLKHVASAFPDEHCILVLDGAGWHQAKELQIPPNLHLVPLPPYSQELNPVEHAWDYLRENWFGNDVFSSLDAVEDRLFEGLRHLVLHPEVVKPMTNFSWINTICLV